MSRRENPADFLELFLGMFLFSVEAISNLALIAFYFLKIYIALYVMIKVLQFLPIFIFLCFFGAGFAGAFAGMMKTLLTPR